MTVNEYIEKNYYLLKNEFYKIASDNKNESVEDLFHDCLEIFMRHKKAQEVIDNGTAKFFLIRIGLNQYRSTSSDYHFTYRLPLTDLMDEIEVPDEEYDVTEDVMMDVLMQSLDSMYKKDDTRYRAMIIILYHSLGNNYSEVERQFNIPRTTVRLHYKEGMEILAQVMNENITRLNNGTFRLNSNLDSFVLDWCNSFGTNEQQALSMASKLFTSKYFSAS